MLMLNILKVSLLSSLVSSQFLRPPGAYINGIEITDAIGKSSVPHTLLVGGELDYARAKSGKLWIHCLVSHQTHSVLFMLDNPPIVSCKRSAPFAVAGGKIPMGSRNFSAVPYLGPDCQDETKGHTFQKTFRVVKIAVPSQSDEILSDDSPSPMQLPISPSFSPTYIPTFYPTALESTFGPSTLPPTHWPTSPPTPHPSWSPSSAAPTQSPSSLETTAKPTFQSVKDSDRDSLQPRVVTVESHPARKVAGVLSIPSGTSWCNGAPTFWLPGHKAENDSPSCFINGKWEMPFTARMDNNDDLNDIDGPEVIDRHDCGALDVNKDGLLDIYCLVGANSGRGLGFNELYLTQPNGSISKVRKHGLQKHNGTRGRFTAVLNGVNGTKLVYLATKGVPRSDRKSNKHRMYRVTGRAPDYFKEVKGPFTFYSNASFTYRVDINHDGLDDLIVGNRMDFASMFVQNTDGTWSTAPWKKKKRLKNWRKIRVADMSGDGIDDLIVAHFGDQGFLRIFEGIREPPYFNFKRRYYEISLPFGIPDLEVIDLNDDGIRDIYVVQSDESKREKNGKLRRNVYCAGKFVHRQWWRPGNQPPADFVPPRDEAPDLLFIGNGPKDRMRDRFQRIRMEHSEPGCGNLVRPFGHKKLLLAQGDFVRPGHNLILDWGLSNDVIA